jgi:dephospho-CoA kinase
MGAAVVDADRIAHEVVEPGSDVLARVVEEFGEEILTDGSLDREKLAAKVFEDGDEIKRLNRIVHPLVSEKISTRVEEERRSGTPMVVVHAALIFEARTESNYDLIVVVNAPFERRLRWLYKERGIDRESAMRVERTQMNPDEKVKRADYVLENEGSIEELQNVSKLLFRRMLDENRAG